MCTVQVHTRDSKSSIVTISEIVCFFHARKGMFFPQREIRVTLHKIIECSDLGKQGNIRTIDAK